jgi:hypothetical protein
VAAGILAFVVYVGAALLMGRPKTDLSRELAYTALVAEIDIMSITSSRISRYPSQNVPVSEMSMGASASRPQR